MEEPIAYINVEKRRLEFAKAFGKDTLSSMAIYIRSLKK